MFRRFFSDEEFTETKNYPKPIIIRRRMFLGKNVPDEEFSGDEFSDIEYSDEELSEARIILGEE
jgi:hypothetical protein